MKTVLAILLLASQANAAKIEDFSIPDLEYKFKKLQVIAHMSDGSECPITLTKDEFYEKYAQEPKKIFALLKEVCEK